MPPLLFAAEIVLVLALSAVAAMLLLGVPIANTQRWRARSRPYVDRQKDLAQSLGLPVQTWLLLRLLCGGAGLLAGAGTRIPRLPDGAGAPGLFGVPRVLGGPAAQRELSMAPARS